jgi:IS30 family transposase
VCAGEKAGNHRRLGMDTYSEIPLYPFRHWSMDLISMPVSKQGNDLIVTWVDRTSKTIVARALKESDSSSSTLAKLTFEAVCCRFGVPHRMTHDNDVRFKTLWVEIMRDIGTK